MFYIFICTQFASLSVYILLSTSLPFLSLSPHFFFILHILLAIIVCYNAKCYRLELVRQLVEFATNVCLLRVRVRVRVFICYYPIDMLRKCAVYVSMTFTLLIPTISVNLLILFMVLSSRSFHFHLQQTKAIVAQREMAIQTKN